MGLKDVAGTVGKYVWDNFIPSFKRGGKAAKGRVLKVVVVGATKPRRRVQKAKRRK